MERMKRAVCLLLCLVMVVGLLPMAVFATDGAVVEETVPTKEVTETPTQEETDASSDGSDVPVTYANNDDGTTTVPGSVTTVENAYVLTDSLSNNGTYLIVNTNAAGDGYALLNDNGSVSAVAVKVVQGDKPYILLDNASAVWTATGSNTSWAFANNDRYLGWTRSDNNNYNYNYNYTPSLSTTSATWTLGTNALYSYLRRNNSSSSNYYLTGGRSWSMSRTAANVYFYAPGTVTVTVPDVTYGITVATPDNTTDSYTAKYVTETTTLALSTSFWSNPAGYEGGVSGGTYAWTSSDEAVATVAADGTVSFTGKAGYTTIRVTYTQGEYVIWDEIVITAEPAGYKLKIVDGNKKSLDGTIAVKGDEALAAGLELNTLVTYEASADNTQEIENAQIEWSVSDPAIASIDENGKLTFTGKEGVITVTASYTDPNGEVHTDTLNVSASKSLYYTPNDGTNDFPEYPNEGAVRIDKNAQAVGNFSETGVTKVELSMTGVPYSAGNEIDVVIMIDMSDSMKNNNVGRVKPARDSAVNALEAIVKNEDGTINNNRVAVYTFNGYDSRNPQNYANAVDEILNLKSYQNPDNKNDTASLTDAKNAVSDWIQNDNTGAGTNYGAALEKCYSVLKAAKEEYPDRKQFVIFVTDGEPTTGFAYETEDGTVADDGYDSNYNNGAADKYYTYTEYYSKQMRAAGVEVYSVGIQLDNDNANTILKKIGGNSTGTAYANPNTHGDYAQFISSNESADKLVDIFEGIVNAIKEAATNVTVTDKITDEYKLVLDTPENVTLPAGTALTIDVTEYTLDANKNRVLPGNVIESVDVNSDKVSKDADGNIISIDADTFTYDASTHTFTWKADKLDTKELALSYYLYLEHSAGEDANQQVDAGTYPTNVEADITYTNHLDHLCKKYFPVPQMTWNGAQVSYTFYLVNAQGQPVNRAGRVLPFAEAIYVTDIYTESVTWDTDEDKMLDAEMIAADLLPNVYELYDPQTSYTINVYEDEQGQDLGNNFVINADKLDANGNSSTKVFNTKAGTIYSAPGTYTAKENDGNKDVFTGFDFANTTVAFGVIWKNELKEDSVVIDFGLDVVIDVTTNDALEAAVVGVRADKPNGIAINSGNYSAAEAKSADIVLNGQTVATAAVENNSSVRLSLNETNGMQLTDPAVFYYESEVSFYNASNVLTTTDLYSSVTVIPATTVYYEDDFVTFTDSSKATETLGKWSVVGNAVDATQDVDRPGVTQSMSDAYDANNPYGYDSAYESMSTWSMGAAHKVTVADGISGMASFTFYGTGFDVVSMTDSTTGTIIVNVYNEKNEVVRSHTVNTYYGYAYQDGEWITVDSSSPNALYQVPVMKIDGLEYGRYTVKIIANYNKLFDTTGNGQYDFYLDAIRIYNPTGDNDEVANDAYIADGEAWPEYTELRNLVIKAETFETLKSDPNNTVSGVVFIDGGITDPDGNVSVSDYTNYGPNNELYLAPGQAIASDLNASKTGYTVASVQLGIKTVGGTGSVQVYSVDASGNVVTMAIDQAISTATDMYYDITALNGSTIVIKNSGAAGSAIVSLTDIKVTYEVAENAASGVAAASVMSVEEDVATVSDAAPYLLSVNARSASYALRSLSVREEPAPDVTEPEETEPETTEPEVEETEPEVTEPETTEPEVEETVPETTEPETDSSGSSTGSTIIRIIKKLLGWLFG